MNHKFFIAFVVSVEANPLHVLFITTVAWLEFWPVGWYVAHNGLFMVLFLKISRLVILLPLNGGASLPLLATTSGFIGHSFS